MRIVLVFLGLFFTIFGLWGWAQGIDLFAAFSVVGLYGFIVGLSPLKTDAERAAEYREMRTRKLKQQLTTVNLENDEGDLIVLEIEKIEKKFLT